MKRTLTSVCAICFLSLLGAIALPAAEAMMPAASVQTEHSFTTFLPWFGRVESNIAVDIPARPGGVIVGIHAADESAVKEGETLFMLAGKAVENRANNLRQQSHQAHAEVAIARKNLRLKRSQRTRGLATNEQVNTAANALALARSHASAAGQALASLHVGTRITAPVSGVFTARAVHIGQYVSAGMLLARIVAPHHSRIRASLFPPAGIQLMGKTAMIHAPDGDIKAAVSAIMPAATAEGGVQLWIDGVAVQSLPPGMQISGSLTLTHRGMAVPVSAIARDDAGHAYLFIRQRHSDTKRWRKQRVITGLHDGNLVEIRSGLKGDEQVAIRGAYELLYGDFGNSYKEED